MEKRKKNSLICKSDVIKRLGISPSKFDKLGLEMVKTVKNQYHSYTYLYDENEVNKLIGTPLIESFKKKEKKPKDYFSIFENKYHDHLEALPLVCHYLFNLNRYPKHASCSQENKEEIYSIKNEIIKFLYNNHYCIRVTEDFEEKFYHELECRNCHGWGCEECDYSGIYSEERNERIMYYCFYFSVNNVTYCWHQLQQYVYYHVEVSTNISEQINPTITKEITLNKTKFKEAKELCKWFLSKEKHNHTCRKIIN